VVLRRRAATVRPELEIARRVTTFDEVTGGLAPAGPGAAVRARRPRPRSRCVEFSA